MNKHTAGKWEYDTSGNHYHAYMSGVIRMNGVLIAKMVTQTTHKPGEVEANARLIAAAPDLLEALTVLADWPLRSLCFDGATARNEAESLANARRFARAAIAERGKS